MHAKETYIVTKEMDTITKETCVPAKETYIVTKEMDTITKVTYVATKETYIVTKVAYVPAKDVSRKRSLSQHTLQHSPQLTATYCHTIPKETYIPAKDVS